MNMETSILLKKHYSELVDVVCNISELHLYSGQLQNAEHILIRCVQFTDHQDIDVKDLMKLQIQLGKLLNQLSFYGKSRFEEAIAVLTHAKQIAESVKDKASLATIFIYLGQAYDYQKMNSDEGDYQIALDYFEQACELFKSINHKEGEGKSLFNIGLIHQRLEDLEKAEIYFKKAYKIAAQYEVKYDLSLAARHLGFINFISENFNLALDYAKESLRLREEIKYWLNSSPGPPCFGKPVYCAGTMGYGNGAFTTS